MGKGGGSSWLTTVKRAFRSPNKENEKRNTRRREEKNYEYEPEEKEEKKREKRRWLFRKSSINQEHVSQQQTAVAKPFPGGNAAVAASLGASASEATTAAEQRHAIVVAVATAAAAEVAVATAQAAVEVARLARPPNYAREHHAVIVIQTAFRGYLSRDGSSIPDDWDERPHRIEEVKAMLQNRKEAALKRERKLSHAFSQQMWRGSRNQSLGNEDDLRDNQPWLDRWMAAKPWESRGRASTDHREPVKKVEIDTLQPYSYLARNFHRSHQYHTQQQRPGPGSPFHKTNNPNHSLHYPITPSPSKSRPLQVRSASPRCAREERSYHTSQTPSLRSNYHYNGEVHQQQLQSTSRGMTSTFTNGAAMPNYMAATESSKARISSQSAPRQRPSTPERERSGSVAKKRLSFPVPDPYNNVGNGYGNYGQILRSPSFKSVSGMQMGFEQQSNYSSCCTESLAGEISPSSTSDIRRWLR